jgi:hypothetical protein
MCTRREECATPTDTNARYAGEADCRARTELACTEWAKLPGAALTPAAVESCAETIRAAPCSDIGTLYYSATGHHPYCLPSGTHVDGGVCVDDSQCASRYCGGETCGTCTTPAEWLDDYAYEGEPCDEPSDCQSFLTCEAGTCTQATCTTPGCLDYGHRCTGISDAEPRDCPLGHPLRRPERHGQRPLRALRPRRRRMPPLLRPTLPVPGDLLPGALHITDRHLVRAGSAAEVDTLARARRERRGPRLPRRPAG